MLNSTGLTTQSKSIKCFRKSEMSETNSMGQKIGAVLTAPFLESERGQR